MSCSRLLGSVALAICVLAAPLGAQKGPALPDLLRLGAEYVAAYAPRVSGASLEETYTMLETSSGRMTGSRRIGSDLVLLNLNGRVAALRDLVSVDTKPLRERAPRILTLLAEPTTARWQQVQEFTRQSLFHFEADLIVQLNEPTLALQLITAENQPRLTYKLDGSKRMNGVQAAGIRFQEPTTRGKTDHILTTRGHAFASGRFWLDPATGTIHQTELWMESATETARITVVYANHPDLNLWLPASMVDTYEQREPGAGPSNMGSGGGYGARRSFDNRAVYANARHVPIDLSRMKK